MYARLIFTLGLLTTTLAAPVGALSAPVSARGLALDEVLQITLQRQASNPRPPPFQSSSWLAELPSVSLSYLDSDQRLGTDEAELSLNLPIKSPVRLRQDEILQSLDEELSLAARSRRALYFSGLIREAAWSWRIASARVEYTQRKLQLLDELLDRQQLLFDAHSSNRYNLLLIRQELADARILQAQEQLEVDTWRMRYRQLTGQGSMPDSLDESSLPSDDAWLSHPDLRLLELGWERQQALITANSAAGGPWNLSLHAKQLDSPEFKEDQYGVALEVPLSLFDTASESDASEWRQASREYWRQRDELQAQLASGATALKAKAEYLSRRQSQLDEAVAISSELMEESRAMLGQNELGRELWVRRMLGNVDRQAESVINQLLIGQNVAMSRQAAGIPL